MSDTLDELVRDACAVGPAGSKAEFRARVAALLDKARIEELEAIPLKPNFLPEYIQDRITQLKGPHERQRIQRPSKRCAGGSF